MSLDQELLEACQKGDSTEAKRLLKRGANINAVNFIGCTPLHLAVYKNNLGLVELLLAFGADRNIRTYRGLLPIEVAHGQHRDAIISKFGQPNNDTNTATNPEPVVETKVQEQSNIRADRVCLQQDEVTTDKQPLPMNEELMAMLWQQKQANMQQELVIQTLLKRSQIQDNLRQIFEQREKQMLIEYSYLQLQLAIQKKEILRLQQENQNLQHLLSCRNNQLTPQSSLVRQQHKAQQEKQPIPNSSVPNDEFTTSTTSAFTRMQSNF